jgi:phytoene dehydrogenase-like protein
LIGSVKRAMTTRFEIKSPIDLERALAMDRGHISHGALSGFFADDEEPVDTWGVETPYERIYRWGSSYIRPAGLGATATGNALLRPLAAAHYADRGTYFARSSFTQPLHRLERHHLTQRRESSHR